MIWARRNPKDHFNNPKDCLGVSLAVPRLSLGLCTLFRQTQPPSLMEKDFGLFRWRGMASMRLFVSGCLPINRGAIDVTRIREELGLQLFVKQRAKSREPDIACRGLSCGRK